MFNWRSSSAYKVGIGHVETGTPCQDRAVHISKNEAQAIVLADGAGSYEQSHLGAELTTVFVANQLCDKFDEFLAMEEGQIAENLIFDIQSQLNFLALQNDQPLEYFSSTLLFVATKGNRFISGHVGDGLIVMAENGRVHVLSNPENGRFENETYFITMLNLGSHFRIYKGTVTENTGFIIMSDGVSCSFYSTELGLDPVNLEIIIQHFQNAEKDTFAQDLDELLGALRENTDDDCSIAVLTTGAKDTIVLEPTSALLITTPNITLPIAKTAVEASLDVDLNELLSSNRFEDEGDDEDFDPDSPEFTYDEEDEDFYDYEDEEEDNLYEEDASDEGEADNCDDKEMLLEEDYDYESDIDEVYSNCSSNDNDEATIVDEMQDKEDATAENDPVTSETNKEK